MRLPASIHLSFLLFPVLIIHGVTQAKASLNQNDQRKTVWSQNITSDTTWTLSNSPYEVTSDIFISGSGNPRLTIEPGVEVRLSKYTELIVGYGELHAVGTESAPIVFTESVPGEGWGGLQFNGGSDDDGATSLLEYCIIEKAGQGYSNIKCGSTSQPTMRNCISRESQKYGAELIASPVLIEDCTFDTNRSYGVSADEATFTRCTFDGNGGAGLYATGPVTLTSCDIINNTGYAIRRADAQVDCVLSGNTYSGNDIDGIFVPGGTCTADQLWENDGVPYYVVRQLYHNQLQFSDASYPRLTIDPGVEVRFNIYAALIVGYGELHAVGTESAPIVFTETVPGQGWEGIQFNGGSDDGGATSLLERCIIEKARSSYSNIKCASTSQLTIRSSRIRSSQWYGMQEFGGQGLLLSNVQFEGNATGLYLSGDARPLLEHCSFVDNKNYGLYASAYSDGLGALNAELCWWNHASGPQNSANPAGTGDVASSNVDYSPWLIAAPSLNQTDLAILSGTVASSITGDPIQGAEVVLESPLGNEVTTTDGAGHWSISAICSSGYSLSVVADGYEGVKVNPVALLCKQETIRDMQLVPLPVQYSNFRILPYGEVTQESPLEIPKGGKGYAWFVVEGERNGEWLPVLGASIKAIDDSGDIYTTRSGSVYYTNSGSVELSNVGAFGMPIPYWKIGSGEEGDTETLRLEQINGTPIPAQYQISVSAVVVPFEYTTEFSYRIYGELGLGRNLSVFKGHVALGGGSGSSIKVYRNSAENPAEWNSFDVSRQVDAYDGFEAKIKTPPVINLVLGKRVTGSESVTSIDTYHFELDRSLGMEPLVAFYLYEEPAIALLPGGKWILQKFLSCMVGTIELNAPQVLDEALTSSEVGLTLKGQSSAGVSLGLDATAAVSIGLVDGFSSEAVLDTRFKYTPSGETTKSLSIYDRGQGQFSIVPFRNLKARSTHYAIPLGDALQTFQPSEFGFGYDATISEHDGYWYHSECDLMFSTDLPEFRIFALPGSYREYRAKIGFDAPAYDSLWHEVSPVPREIEQFGVEPVDVTLSSETMADAFFGLLDANYNARDSELNTPAEYSSEVTNVSSGQIDVNLDFGIGPSIHFGGGWEYAKESSYELTEGFLVDGTPYLIREALVLPVDDMGEGEVRQRLWGLITDEAGAIWGPFWDMLRERIRSVGLWPVSKRLNDVIILNTAGSSWQANQSAYPSPGSEDVQCLFWEWEDQLLDAKMPLKTAMTYRNYNRSLRNLRETILGTRYGVGGFFAFEPDTLKLLEPGTLTIRYSDLEIVGIDESTLSIFRENDRGSLDHIVSTAYPDSNKVVAEIDSFGTYCVAPRLPGGNYILQASPDVLPADGLATTTFSSPVLVNNDGTVIPDSTLFTVIADRGEILGDDQDPNLAGRQVLVLSHGITFDVQSDFIFGPISVSAHSETGNAVCTGQVELYDPGLPTAPTITGIHQIEDGFSIAWAAPGDRDLAGYLIWYDTDEPGAPYDGAATIWGQNSPVSVGLIDSLTVTELEKGKTYYVSITSVDLAGNQSPYSEEVAVIATAVDITPTHNLVLAQNYPNPFNPHTKIRYSLPRAGRVLLKVYNQQGRLVRTLVDGVEQPGRHEVIWRAEDQSSRAVASGVYLCVLQTDQGTMARKMVVVR